MVLAGAWGHGNPEDARAKRNGSLEAVACALCRDYQPTAHHGTTPYATTMVRICAMEAFVSGPRILCFIKGTRGLSSFAQQQEARAKLLLLCQLYLVGAVFRQRREQRVDSIPCFSDCQRAHAAMTGGSTYSHTPLHYTQIARNPKDPTPAHPRSSSGVLSTP